MEYMGGERMYKTLTVQEMRSKLIDHANNNMRVLNYILIHFKNDDITKEKMEKLSIATIDVAYALGILLHLGILVAGTTWSDGEQTVIEFYRLNTKENVYGRD